MVEVLDGTTPTVYFCTDIVVDALTATRKFLSLTASASVAAMVYDWCGGAIFIHPLCPSIVLFCSVPVVVQVSITKQRGGVSCP